MRKLIAKALVLFDLWLIIVASTVFTTLYFMGSEINLISITIFVISFAIFNLLVLITLSLLSLKSKLKKLENA